MGNTPQRVLAVCAGNSTARYGLYHDGDVIATGVADASDIGVVVEEIAGFTERAGDDFTGASVVLGASNKTLASALMGVLPRRLACEIFRIGMDLPVPVRHTLDDAEAIGEDRLLNAVGAYAMVSQACVVVDAGTAVTVDFVDGEGAFHGGAIAPGAQMALDALHRGADALGAVKLRVPDEEVFGKNTEQAMLNGVYYGIRGMVRALTERYAVRYDAYPFVIATGGDAVVLFEGDELVERIVPDLTLRGIVRSCSSVLDPDGESPAKKPINGVGS